MLGRGRWRDLGDRTRQQLQRAGRRADLVGGDPQILRGRCQAAMAEQKLDGTDIGAGLKKVYGEGMPQRMRRYGLGEFRQLMCLAACGIDRVGGYRRVVDSTWKHPG